MLAKTIARRCIIMKIDYYDKSMVLDKEDVIKFLSNFQEKRNVSDYIELSIISIVCEKIGILFNGAETLNELMDRLPREFIDDVIFDINNMFFENKQVDYKNKQLSYLIYYLPANLFKIWKPLLDLQLKNMLKPNLRVLDIGTGPGSIPIGIIEYYSLIARTFPDQKFKIIFSLVDAQKEFTDIANSIILYVSNYIPDNLTIVVDRIENSFVQSENDYSHFGKYDIITFSNFMTFNESTNTDNGYNIIRTFKKFLNDDGSIIIIEPADEINCKNFKKLRNEIVNTGLMNIFSPCIGVWNKKTHYDCNCFNMVRSFWNTPDIYKLLSQKGLKKGSKNFVPFNYVVFRKDNNKKYAAEKNQKGFTLLSEIHGKNNEVVNIMALIRTAIYNKSGSLSISLCDGTCDYSDGTSAVWLNLSSEQLSKQKIDVKLLTGERIRINKIKVIQDKQKPNLYLNDDSRIHIDY